jgi:hypothetical protein
MQPADVGLDRVIKHRLKQAQMNYIVKAHQQQLSNGLIPEQVKISISLPELCDIVEVYDFMTGPTGQDLVKKVGISHTNCEIG